MIKVVHLITLLEFGGAQGNTIHTVKHLNPEKYETHLWTGKGAFWDKEIERALGPSGRLRFFSRLVRPIHPLKDLLAVFDLVKALKDLKPQILHTHSSKAGILGRIAGHLAGVPVIIHTFHGFGFNDQQRPIVRWFFVLLEKWAARYSHALVFVSKANMNIARKLGFGNPETFVLIRSGVPMKFLQETGKSVNSDQIKSDLGFSSSDRMVLTISAFKPQKNLEDLIRVADLVCQKVENARFVFLGDGEQRVKLEELIKKLNLSNKIHLPGWRKDAAQVLAASDVFVLTSLWEGLPRSLIEALIMGKPAVCYDTDGISEVLEMGGGTLIRQGDTQSMAEAIIRLLMDPSFKEKLSFEAKSMISKEFDIDEMVHAQEILYHRLLGSLTA